MQQDAYIHTWRESVFFMKPQGLVAQDILTGSLQQLHNCHINAKSEIQAKLMFACKTLEF